MDFNDSLSIGMDDFSNNEDVDIPEVLPMMAVRDVVIFNAAAALLVADKASNLKEGAELAAEAIDAGKAKYTLEKLVEITNSDNEGADA